MICIVSCGMHTSFSDIFWVAMGYLLDNKWSYIHGVYCFGIDMLLLKQNLIQKTPKLDTLYRIGGGKVKSQPP